MKTTYSELNKFFGRKVKIKDKREKEWYGVVDNITSAEDNEEDEVPGEVWELILCCMKSIQSR